MTPHPKLTPNEARTVARALRAMERVLTYGERPALNSPQLVRDYLTLRIAASPVERFLVLYLDNQNRLLQVRCISEGTLTQTVVYPREVVRGAIENNAAAVIFSHNHPSGLAEPSMADRTLTTALKRALDTIDVRVLDHIIVGGTTSYSFAEHGLI